jgi:hypothetical protein
VSNDGSLSFKAGNGGLAAASDAGCGTGCKVTSAGATAAGGADGSDSGSGVETLGAA